MNQKTTYEILIGEQLQHLPVPDMADAIWSRIEAQLDIEMPGDSGDTNSPGNGGGSFPIGNLLLVFVAALVTVYFVIRPNQKDADIEFIPTDSEQQIATPEKNDEGGPPVNNALQPARSLPLQNDLTSNPLIPADSAGILNFFPILLQPNDSSQQNGIVITPQLQQPPVDTSKPQPKKSKGVTGITNDDYRIVPAKKDSTKN